MNKVSLYINIISYWKIFLDHIFMIGNPMEKSLKTPEFIVEYYNLLLDGKAI